MPARPPSVDRVTAIPLGASSRRGGLSAGYVWAIFLSFFCYYLAYISLTRMASARNGVRTASITTDARFVVILAFILVVSSTSDAMRLLRGRA